MPRRAGTSFYPVEHAYEFSRLVSGFNAPKGWYLFLTASSGGIITLFFINPAVLGVNCHSERNTFSQNPHVARNFTQPYPHRWQYVLA